MNPYKIPDFAPVELTMSYFSYNSSSELLNVTLTNYRGKTPWDWYKFRRRPHGPGQKAGWRFEAFY